MTAERFGAKPSVLLAAIFERAIRDSDNMLTMVRMIDVVNVASNAPADVMSKAIAEQGAPVQGQMVLVFKGGELDATHEVAVAAHSPNGEVREFPPISSVFGSTVPGGVPGSNVIVNIQMSVKSEGIYWFEVKLDGETVTSVPLQIAFQTLSSGESQE
jgi:hypothetical protein